MPRRVLEGKVISDKMDKTVTVLIERRYMHPVYKKFVRTSTKLAAHDENNSFKTGDFVQIEECRPISKNKSFRVITVPGPDAGRPARQKADTTAEESAKKAKREEKKAEKKAVKAEAAPAEKADSKGKKAAAPKKEKAPAKKATSKKKDE
jgi:small subunit ribosomal protein S17